MNHLDTFSGIGGFALAARWVWGEAHRIVAFVEKDPFCQKVLGKHWPDAPIHGDIKEFDGKQYRGAVDIITGGYPCQPDSIAGKRRGKEDDRWLWPEMFRVVKEARPRWVVGENVANHVQMGLDDVLSDLADEAYTTQALVIPACAVNARHRRDRVWIVAYSEQVRPGRLADFTSGNDFDREAAGRQEGPGGAEQCGQDVADTARQLFDGGGHAGPGRRSESTDGCFLVADTESPRLERRLLGRDSGQALAGFGEGGWSVEDCWRVEPDVGRVAHGIPRRVDRLRALGNAIVPQVAYEILRCIKEVDG